MKFQHGSQRNFQILNEKKEKLSFPPLKIESFLVNVILFLSFWKTNLFFQNVFPNKISNDELFT